MPNYPNYGGIIFGPYNNQMNNGYYNAYMQPQQQAMQRPSDGRTYVNGRAGADAYPIPAGVNEIILWDTEAKRYYVKGYDNNGMPRVLEDNDYAPHVEPEKQTQPQVDFSQYATKDDIQKMISNAFAMSTFVTRQEFDKGLSELSVGNGGGMSSRRYYDDGGDHAVQKLHQMMDAENDPRIKSAMQEVIHKLEMK